jgi:glycosyltransferase involved in cell wall biosynthesis
VTDWMIDKAACAPPRELPRRGGACRRVLLVAPQPFYAERGTPIAVRYVLEALSQLGFEIDVLTLPVGSPVEIPGVQLIRIANPFGIEAVPIGLSLRKLLFAILMLRSLALRLRRSDYVCVHAVEESALLALLAGGRRKLPLIYDMQSSLPEQLAQTAIFRPAPIRALFRWIETYMLRRASVVMCSAGLAGHVRALAPTARLHEWRFPAAARAIPPEEVADLRQQLGLAAQTPVVLYAGNFAGYQGIHLVFDAIPAVARQIPEAVFVLVGAADQSEIDRTQHRLAANVRARVHCLPRQPRRRIDTFIAMATVLISPRRYGGNFPLKVFDYLAAGKPIVATDVPTHRAVLDESLALLVAPSAPALADGIARVLKDHELAASLAAAAARFAQHELPWARFVNVVEQLYAEALEPRTAPAVAGTARHV